MIPEDSRRIQKNLKESKRFKKIQKDSKKFKKIQRDSKRSKKIQQILMIASIIAKLSTAVARWPKKLIAFRPPIPPNSKN